jgi:GTP-binding protein
MTSKTATLVALIGRPNVGKSTLFNRLARRRDALVDPTPGVTRDRHYARVSWEEQPFLLVDTGGIEEEGDPMAGHIRQQALLAVEEAEVIFFLMDGREAPTSRCSSSSTRSTARRSRTNCSPPSGSWAWTGCGLCPATTATA